MPARYFPRHTTRTVGRVSSLSHTEIATDRDTHRRCTPTRDPDKPYTAPPWIRVRNRTTVSNIQTSCKIKPCGGTVLLDEHRGRGGRMRHWASVGAPRQDAASLARRGTSGGQDTSLAGDKAGAVFC